MEKPLVLLADDNQATCTLITALLQNEFTVDIASDGQEAIEKLKGRQYAAILLDLLMPLVDGYAFLDYVQRERPETFSRIIVVTASLTAREMERVRAYPVRAIIAKPFEVEVLQAAVRQCAGTGGDPFLRGPLISGGMLFLLAEVLRRV